MHRGSLLVRSSLVSAFFAVTVLMLGLVACGPSGPTEEETQAANQITEWQWLETTKASLDEKRTELASLRERIEADAEAGAADAEEAAQESAAELAAKAETLRDEIVSTSDELMGRLVGHINDLGIAVGGELSAAERQAIRMKTDEEIFVAKEYIDRGGDYRKALEIYDAAKQFDPDNEKLLAAIEEAGRLQYMSKDRFSQVKKKMSQAEVRKLLGQVNLHNVKEYEENGTVAWFYRKEDGGAAGVYFRERKKGEGNWQVYATDLDAVKPQQQES